jgi:hypothetical protein
MREIEINIFIGHPDPLPYSIPIFNREHKGMIENADDTIIAVIR